MGISGHSWLSLMPIVVMLVSARSDGRSDASSLDLSSGPIKKRTIKQKAFGFRVRLRIPPAGRPRCCSVAIDTHDDVKTLVLGTSVRHAQHGVEAALARGQSRTMPFLIFHERTQQPLTDLGMNMFQAGRSTQRQTSRSR